MAGKEYNAASKCLPGLSARAKPFQFHEKPLRPLKVLEKIIAAKCTSAPRYRRIVFFVSLDLTNSGLARE